MFWVSLIVKFSVKLSSRLGLYNATPLLEKERDLTIFALFSNRNDPIFLNRPAIWPAFATNDYPVHPQWTYRDRA